MQLFPALGDLAADLWRSSFHELILGVYMLVAQAGIWESHHLVDLDAQLPCTGGCWLGWEPWVGVSWTWGEGGQG